MLGSDRQMNQQHEQICGNKCQLDATSVASSWHFISTY